VLVRRGPGGCRYLDGGRAVEFVLITLPLLSVPNGGPFRKLPPGGAKWHEATQAKENTTSIPTPWWTVNPVGAIACSVRDHARAALPVGPSPGHSTVP